MGAYRGGVEGIFAPFPDKFPAKQHNLQITLDTIFRGLDTRKTYSNVANNKICIFSFYSIYSRFVTINSFADKN